MRKTNVGGSRTQRAVNWVRKNAVSGTAIEAVIAGHPPRRRHNGKPQQQSTKAVAQQ